MRPRLNGAREIISLAPESYNTGFDKEDIAVTVELEIPFLVVVHLVEGE